jgi:hypothetical protein
MENSSNYVKLARTMTGLNKARENRKGNQVCVNVSNKRCRKLRYYKMLRITIALGTRHLLLLITSIKMMYASLLIRPFVIYISRSLVLTFTALYNRKTLLPFKNNCKVILKRYVVHFRPLVCIML